MTESWICDWSFFKVLGKKPDLKKQWFCGKYSADMKHSKKYAKIYVKILATETLEKAVIYVHLTIKKS